MPKSTGPTNPLLMKLIEDIRERGYKEKIPFLIEIAKKLETSRRIKHEVNLTKLDKICKENETVIIPGKVLSTGNLKKPLTVAAASFSMTSINKIQKAGGKALSIKELVESNPKGTNVRIVM
jgi:large subunit ribosomal protein L18e